MSWHYITMCSSFAIFLFVPVFLLGDASSPISSSTEVVSRFQEEALHLNCPSCSLPHTRKNSSSFEGQTEMVEAVKRHILNMLHLNARPNLTQPVPRAALFNVIKKLHFGHIAEDGSVEIQDKIQGPREPTLHEPPSEIITFGEAGDSPDKVVFNLVTEGGGSVVVEQANVWIFLMKSKVVRMKRKVMLRLLQPNQGEEGETTEECISEKMVDTQRSGWHMLAVPQTVQQLLSSGGSSLRLQISCPLCGEVGVSPILTSARGGHPTERDQSHRPFLMVMLRVGGETSQQRVKRGLECDARIHVCCKRQFYINFKDIGWSDWIIAPSGYHANYCEGDCPNHMSNIGSLSHSFHSAVINHYRMRGYSPFQNMKSCCVPTRLQAMSMLYYNEEQKIIKKDIQNMIVEECGCS